MYSYSPIDLADLTATDLKIEAQGGGPLASAYRIDIWREVVNHDDPNRPYVVDEESWPEAAQALVIPFAEDASEGRIGIAWGADADWGDVHHLCDGDHDIEEAIEDWLNDEKAWERRA